MFASRADKDEEEDQRKLNSRPATSIGSLGDDPGYSYGVALLYEGTWRAPLGHVAEAPVGFRSLSGACC